MQLGRDALLRQVERHLGEHVGDRCTALNPDDESPLFLRHFQERPVVKATWVAERHLDKYDRHFRWQTMPRPDGRLALGQTMVPRSMWHEHREVHRSETFPQEA